MLTSLYAKLAGFVLVLAALAGLFLWGHHVGAAGVQAKWDKAKLAQAVVVEKAQADNAAQATKWINSFSAIGAQYEATTHAQFRSMGDQVAAGVASGAVRLRGSDTGACRGLVPAATARSRAADAAATQALADRVQAAIAAVRAGDAADRREAHLDAQVIGLQGVLKAERNLP